MTTSSMVNRVRQSSQRLLFRRPSGASTRVATLRIDVTSLSLAPEEGQEAFSQQSLCDLAYSNQPRFLRDWLNGHPARLRT